jgi:hypothetical protein
VAGRLVPSTTRSAPTAALSAPGVEDDDLAAVDDRDAVAELGFVHAPSTPLGQAQQLVELIQQLVAALNGERVQQDEHERVAACGLQAPQLPGGHPAPERSSARRRAGDSALTSTCAAPNATSRR